VKSKTREMDQARRKLLLDQVAAGQFNGISHPSHETRESAFAAFGELYEGDPAYRALIDKNRRLRYERSWRGRLKRWLRGS
jgi:hypothetical protein